MLPQTATVYLDPREGGDSDKEGALAQLKRNNRNKS